MVSTKKTTGFKTRQDVEAIDAFIKGDLHKPDPSQISFSELKRLTVDELADQLESINNQSLLLTWMICMEIREHFRSDPEMGQYIKDLREKNPYHPLCIVTQQHRNRYIHAARYCVRHNILNISKESIGMSPTAFYELSKPDNLDVADEIFNKVRKEKRNYTCKSVELMIKQAKSISIEKEEEKPQITGRVEYDSPIPESRTVQVINNIAHDFGIIDGHQETDINAELEYIADDIEGSVIHHQAVPPVTLPEHAPQATTQALGYNEVFSQMRAKVDQEEIVEFDRRKGDRRRSITPEMLWQHNEKHTFTLSDVSSDDLLLELASRQEKKTPEEMRTETMLFLERFDVSFSEQAKLARDLEKTILSMVK